jgi:PadR family transcriptional regulator, regulatory protein AphA
MSSPNHRLSTTSHGLLGQLALRSWTAYDLAAEVHRNFRYFAPRAESHVYAELKRLRRLGLARTSLSYTGKRRRTTYFITPAGRHALQSWLRTPISPQILEHEAVLRMLLAPLADRETLLQVLEQAISNTDELLSEVRPRIGREYMEGRAPFQNHAHVRAFVFQFITEFHIFLRDWAIDAHAAVSEWDSIAPEGKRKQAIDRIKRETNKRPRQLHVG